MKLSNPALDKLFANGTKYKFARGEVIQSTDDHQTISLLRKGYVKRYLITSKGTISVQNIYGPGYIFPLTLIFKLLFEQEIYQGREQYYYEALTEIELLGISNDTFFAATKSDPNIYPELLKVTGARLLSNIWRLENMSVQPAQKRLAHLLAFYAVEFGWPVRSGVQILIPFRHHDLAADLDVARETVSLAMTELENRGVIKTGKFIVIPSLEKLQDEAYN